MPPLIDESGEGKKLSKWATYKEFMSEEGKLITPLSAKWICGDEFKADAKFRHNKQPDGCTRRLIFIDHDNGNVERWYENCFPSFTNAIKDSGVVIGEKYYAKVMKNSEGHYEWDFMKA